MNDQQAFEREVETWMAEAATSPPDQTLSDILVVTGRERPLPRWLALIKEPPMRISSNLAVGSPMVRVAAIMVATLLLALMVAGAGIAGSRLLAADGPIVVDQSGNGTTTTIAAAVEMAENGDIILVRPGTYDESVVLDKDITIRGDGDRDEVVVELSVEMPPGGTHNPPNLPAAFKFESSDAVIENLTLRGISSRIVINGGSPELRDLVFDGVGKVYRSDDQSAPTGLLIDEGSTALVESNVMVDTDIGIRPGSSPMLLGNEITVGAIWIDGAGDLGTEPVIRENTIDASVKWGITIWGARPEVVGNTIVDAIVGIAVEDPGTAATVRGNIISGSIFQGINVTNGAGATIEQNRLTDNGIGISTDSSDASLIGNAVSGGSLGVSIVRGSPTLEANEIEGSKRGLVIGAGATPTLEGNIVCGNTINLEVSALAEMPETAGNEICEDTPAE